MSRIITIKATMEVGDCVLIPLLGDAGQQRAYEIEALSGSIRSSGTAATEGVMVGLQDGEVEEALLDRATPSGPSTTFVDPQALRDAELHIYGSIGLSGAGTGGGAHDSRSHNFLPPYRTANPQFLILMSAASGSYGLLIHIQYTEIKVEAREWTGLKHRPNVIDKLLGSLS